MHSDSSSPKLKCSKCNNLRWTLHGEQIPWMNPNLFWQCKCCYLIPNSFTRHMWKTINMRWVWWKITLGMLPKISHATCDENKNEGKERMLLLYQIPRKTPRLTVTISRKRIKAITVMIKGQGIECKSNTNAKVTSIIVQKLVEDLYLCTSLPFSSRTPLTLPS